LARVFVFLFKIVRGETEDHESFVLELLVKRFKSLELGGVAALTRRIDGKDHFPPVGFTEINRSSTQQGRAGILE
jgi:hypothetical protein